MDQLHINSTTNKELVSSSTKTKNKNMKDKKKKKSKAKLEPMKPKPIKSKEKRVTSEKPTKPNGSKRKRTKLYDVYDDVEAKFSVMERAERVLSTLSEEVPTFIKCMLPSNVCYSFWMILPTKFCKLYLPTHDTTITLVNEWGNEYKTTFLLDRHGLSAGWRGFSMSHRLLKGDILLFQLIEPCKFKVHVVRVNGAEVVDAALCLMNIDAWRGTTESDPVKDKKKSRRPRKYADCFLLDAPKAETKIPPTTERLSEQTENNSNVSGSGEYEGSECSNSIEDNDIRCCGSLFLHEHPLEGVACI